MVLFDKIRQSIHTTVHKYVLSRRPASTLVEARELQKRQIRLEIELSRRLRYIELRSEIMERK